MKAKAPACIWFNAALPADVATLVVHHMQRSARLRLRSVCRAAGNWVDAHTEELKLRTCRCPVTCGGRSMHSQHRKPRVLQGEEEGAVLHDERAQAREAGCGGVERDG